MSVSPDSSVSQRDVNSLAVDSRPFFPFEVFTQLDGMSPASVLAIQQMYEAYCQACVSVANINQVESDGSSGSSCGSASSASSRPNRRQRRRAARKARSRGSSSVSERSAKSGDADRGVGYCYLGLVKSEFKSAVAADLGANPSLAELARLPKDKVSLESVGKLRFEKVSTGQWHCGEKGSYSVQQVMSALRSVYCTIVGSFGSQFQPSAGLSVSHGDLLGYMNRAVFLDTRYDWTGFKQEMKRFVSREFGGVLLYSLSDAYVSDMSKVSLTKSEVCRVESYRSGSGDWLAKFELCSSGLAVAKCPVSTVVRLNGVEFLVSGSSVYVAFKGSVSFTCVVSEFGFVDVPVLVASHTAAKVVEYIVPAKSTDARFFRSQGGTAVLSRPVELSTGTDQYETVSLTDPLQQWVAIQKDRLQGGCSDSSKRFSIGAYGWQALTACRADVQSEFRIAGLARITDSDTFLLFMGKVSLEVGGRNRLWSIRRNVVADDYAMDGGGPSDSEGFSDAI